MSKCLFFPFFFLVLVIFTKAQVPVTDTIPVISNDPSLNPKFKDSSVRVINLSPAFIQHVDSVDVYQFKLNRPDEGFYWYLKTAPVGLTINKANGEVNFKAAKNYFLSGKLKYDQPYKVGLIAQSYDDPGIRIDTSFYISFYNTEIIPSKIKLSIAGTLYIEEGENVSFKVQCETGSFGFENIFMSSTLPVRNASAVKNCNDEFSWTPAFDFIPETESGKTKNVVLSFIGSAKYRMRDTATINIIVRNAVDYPTVKAEYDLVYRNVETYILKIKYAFLQLDKKLRKVKSTRVGFDLTSASTALTGTILNNSGATSDQKTGKILPSIGVAMVPIKEAVAPNKNVEQNQAGMIRGFIKRLEFLLSDNSVTNDRDPDILRKTNKLKDELKQVQLQLVDIPVDINDNMSEEELNLYFNSEKVNRKYRVKK